MVRHINLVVGTLVLGLAAGCAQQEKEPDPAPPPAAAREPRPEIDFESIMGVARARRNGIICVAIPAAHAPGDQLTLVSVPAALARPDSTPTDYSTVLYARITDSGAKDCTPAAIGSGLRLPGDSVYTVTIVRDTVNIGTVYFAVALPFDAFFRVGQLAGARMSRRSTDVLNFRICASAEGLHLTAWDGKPLAGKRVWHRYYYLGQDTKPSCVEKDYS